MKPVMNIGVTVRGVRPQRAHLVVDRKLLLENHIPLLVDRVCRLALILLARIYGAPLAVPHTEPVCIHPLALLLVAPAQAVQLHVVRDELLRRRGEAEDGVIVDRVRDVVPALDASPKCEKSDANVFPSKETAWCGSIARIVLSTRS